MYAHTGVVSALDWSPPSSPPARRRVELPEVNVILGDLITSIGSGAKEGHRGWDKFWERGRPRRKERTDR